MSISTENDNYVPFRVSTLRGDQKINFDAYIKLNGRLILYLRRGDSFEGKRLQRLKEKKLKSLYLHHDDESKYRSYLKRNIQLAFDFRSDLSVENRAEIIHGTQQARTEDVFENASSIDLYLQAKQSTEKFVEFLRSEEKAFPLLMNIENTDLCVAHHGVSVATLATMVASKIWNFNDQQIHLLTLGALFHDFGYYHHGPFPKKPLSQYNGKEMELYKNHPHAGVEAIKGKKHFEPQVVRIIRDHEERIDASGFPRGIEEQEIDLSTKVVSICDTFDRLITFEGVPKKRAIRDLMSQCSSQFPPRHVQILGELMDSALRQ